ncbi:hypothetical protein BN1263170323 [Stenotrophomonas maltophilia]|nr:hypothetical protein BN1263170323 [Stenotrophomonas maltophilia]
MMQFRKSEKKDANAKSEKRT